MAPNGMVRGMTRRVAITGMGIVTCYGIGTAVTWGKILAGEPGIRPITLFDTTDYRTTRAGEFTDSAGRALEAISRRTNGPRLEPAASRPRRRTRGIGPVGDRLGRAFHRWWLLAPPSGA